MKRLVLCIFIVTLFLCTVSSVAFADIGPKPTLDIIIKDLNDNVFYLDLLSKDGDIEYKDFNDKYPESYKELPLYRYNQDGWLATHIRNSILWGELKVTNDEQNQTGSKFTYFGIPDVFKVIIQLESGEIYVSNEYAFNEFNQITTIDFEKDMVKVEDKGNTCRISGFIKPELNCGVALSMTENQGIRIEVLGTQLSAKTDEKGYFELYGVGKNTAGYELKISKPGYLTRYIDFNELTSDIKISENDSPIEIWAGDALNDGVQDEAINLVDVVTVAKSYNSVSGESRFFKDYDFDSDRAISMGDIMLMVRHFNKGSKDYPRLTLPALKPTSVPMPVDVYGEGKMQAENMRLNRYSVDEFDGDACVKLNESIGVVSYIFKGNYGYYDVNIRYLDESSGQGSLGLYVHNVRVGNSWKLNEDDNKWKIKTLKGVLIKEGDEIMVQGNKDADECMRVDYVETVLTSVPTATPTPVVVTIRGALTWNDLETGSYYINNYILGSTGFAGVKEGTIVEVTGYVSGNGHPFLPGIPFKVLSYKVVNQPTPAPTPTPSPVTVKGTLVWNSFEGGFYGVVGVGQKYDIGNGLPGMESLIGSQVEITGYPEPEAATFHMSGIWFDLQSYKAVND